MIIYYFSGTGNSMWIAQEINKNIDCKIIPITQAVNKNEYPTEEKIGFVFPLYYQNMPEIMYDMVNKIDFSKTNYIFAVCTRGFAPTGGVFAQFNDILKKYNKKIDYSRYINMPSNDVTVFDIPSKKEQEKILNTVDNQLKPVIDSIKNNKRHKQFEPIKFIREIRRKVLQKEMREVPNKYYAEDKCSGCGICEQVCPMDNITMSDKRPVWNNKCQLCEGCINYCPIKAIQYGNSSQKKERYHHPKISWKDIKEQKMVLNFSTGNASHKVHGGHRE